MATPEQRARRKAQRATARAVKERRRQLPRGVTERARVAPTEHARAILRGEIEEPAPDRHNMESRSLARQASLARWGKADAEFAAFEHHFYKHRKSQDEEDEE